MSDLKQFIKNTDPNDISLYKVILNRFMNEMNYDESQMMTFFNASRGTIQRWLSGESSPMPPMTTAMYNHMLKVLP